MEQYFKNIGLTDIEIYYLAKELGLKQIVGLEIDYDSLNKETKNEAHQICYDFFKEHNILEMDFSGDTVVDEQYAQIITAFEDPEYCCVLLHYNKETNESACRKIYKNGDVWTALDYFASEKSAVFVFPDENTANEFMFDPVQIKAAPNVSDLPEDKTAYLIADYASFAEHTSQTVMLTEYTQKDGEHIAQQKLYVEQNNVWYELQCADETFTKIPVTQTICLRESEEQ